MGKEKKEIWMEKLIELLNEFEKTLEPNLQVRWTVLWIEATPELIVGKKFWFIKWLVENDKIDISKVNDKNLNGYEIELRIRAVKELVADSEEKTVLYLNLLMLLAIQDEPIRFLCEILK